MTSALMEPFYSVHECQKRVEEIQVGLEEEGFDIVMLHLGILSHLGLGDSSVGGYFTHIVPKLQRHQKMPFFEGF